MSDDQARRPPAATVPIVPVRNPHTRQPPIWPARLWHRSRQVIMIAGRHRAAANSDCCV